MTPQVHLPLSPRPHDSLRPTTSCHTHLRAKVVSLPIHALTVRPRVEAVQYALDLVGVGHKDGPWCPGGSLHPDHVAVLPMEPQQDLAHIQGRGVK